MALFVLANALWVISLFARSLSHAGDDFPAPYNSPSEKGLSPMPASEAAARMKLPPGFQARLFASEPLVQNPIAMTWDRKHRLWVAENFTYSDRFQRFDLNLRDRVLIFEDTDGDGRADTRRVFTDKVQILTSVEVGKGGVWLMCPPRLLFIPDANEDGIPDGPSQVMLDGFTVAQESHHNFANGLKWGPDGWLYGRCGHSCPGKIGVPGAAAAERIPIKGGIWRFHPERKTFEMLCHGTVNPWGHDWDAQGELFFINTVIGHLWHCLPGAHFKESSGESPNPAVYERMDMIADHSHFDTGKSWTDSRGGKANDYGGGHAHSGMMIYQGSQWPASFHGKLFTLNLHGLRINVDRLEQVPVTGGMRALAGYVGRHEPDFLVAADPFFRGIDLNTGPDGQGYLIDWSDTGECHESTGVHRTSGRIFQIRHGEAKARIPVSKPACLAGPGPLPELWRAFQAGELSESLLLAKCSDPDEHVRAWAIRLLSDRWPLDTLLGPKPGTTYPLVSSAVRQELLRLAREDASGLVQLTLASTLQRLAVPERIVLAREIVHKPQFAQDRDLPYLVWYGLIPVGQTDPQSLIAMAQETTWPRLIRWTSRLIASQAASQPAPLETLLAAAKNWPEAKQKWVLEGLAEAFRGWHRFSAPKAWNAFAVTDGAQKLPELVRELNLLFGDGRALKEIRSLALSAKTPLLTRQKALEQLIEARPEDLRFVCETLLDTRGLNAIAAKGLAQFDDPSIAQRLAAKYKKFAQEDRPALLEVLVSRRTFAGALLKELASAQGAIPVTDVTAVHARQIRNLNDDALTRQLAQVWGELRDSSAEKQAQIRQWKTTLTSSLTSPNLSEGRALFERHCATCHVLFGTGQKVGPDLTGSQRENLDYLLENILDPSATVSKDFRASVVAMKDGRVFTGLITSRAPKTVTLQTATEKKTLSVDDIEEVRATQQSPMPDGLLQNLSQEQVKNLIAYLRHPHQVALPTP